MSRFRSSGINTGDERLAGLLVGRLAQIAADPNVHQFWPMHESFMQGVNESGDLLFACRPAKHGDRSMILRPSEIGYRPGYFSITGGGMTAGYLRFGTGSNGGPAGGSLGNTHNGALETATDAMVFPQQDGVNGIRKPYTLVSVAKTTATGDDVYPGSIFGSMTRFPDDTGTLSDWAGLGVGYGGSSEDDAFFAARGTTGKASSTTNRADGAWHVYTGIYDPVAEVYKLRVDGTQVTSTAFATSGSTASQPTVQRRGYQAARLGAAGDIGAAIERTWIGDIGPTAIMHVVGDDEAYLASLTRIENVLKTIFEIA